MRQSWSGSGLEIEALPGVTSDMLVADACGACRTDDPGSVELSFELENDPALIPEVLSQLSDVWERLRLFDDGTSQRVGLALHEAILNGIHHGNLELDSALRQDDDGAYQRLAARRRRLARYRLRRLHFRARFDSTGAVFVIRDDGHGFDPAGLSDPTDPANLDRPSGRGLLLIRAFMDEVSFNPTGNQVTLFKRRTPTPQAQGRSPGPSRKSVQNTDSSAPRRWIGHHSC